MSTASPRDIMENRNEKITHETRDSPVAAGHTISHNNSRDFAVGDRVIKISGYGYPGEIVSIFQTKSGKTRYVVEATGEGYEGMLHIFNGDQLRPLA